ncbi:hypothetical protein HY969_03215 [Candidatus Kaiserbacteria bacterium]|nr:hypothetical protein [Candidatus Kaiserbacteria bacterium]
MSFRLRTVSEKFVKTGFPSNTPVESASFKSLTIAKVPLSELFGFTTQLRSATEGRAVPNLEFSHYVVVPRNVQEEIIASRK